jgi:plastocyanin
MNRYLKLAGIFVVAVVVLITGYFVLNAALKKNPNPTTQNAKNANNVKASVKYIPAQTITLTSSGFQPQTLTIKSGARVIWINRSGVVGSVNSDNYPTNLLYPFLNFGQFANGSSFSTVFNKTGTYTYYNFPNPSQKGKIIVE